MSSRSSNPKGLVLVTGATGFIGSRVAEALLAQGRRLALLCRPASAHRLWRRLGRLPEGVERPLVVHGDLHQADLAVDGADLSRLQAEATEVFHLAAAYDLRMSDEQTRLSNVTGTRHVLDLAERLPLLERFHHVSTMAVAGDLSGVYREKDFDLGQSFFHAYGRTKFEAEREVRERGLPATVYRPGAVVGDSRSGKMDKLDGPYFVFAALHALRRLPGAGRMPMIVPRGDDSMFHLVPVDFVVAAMVHLAGLDSSLGRTYHLMDPDPASYRQFYLATLREMGFSGPTIARPVTRLVKLLMLPGLWQLSRLAGRTFDMPAEMLPHLLYDIRYDTSQTTSDLTGSGIACPRVLDYLPVLIRYFERNMAG